jgi:hypothetical protein
MVPGSSESLSARLGSAGAASEEASGTTDLLIQGLVDRLPGPDTVWPLDKRAKWLRTAASIFGLVYKTSDGEDREISVVFTKEEAATQPKAGPVAEPKDKSVLPGEPGPL